MFQRFLKSENKNETRFKRSGKHCSGQWVCVIMCLFKNSSLSLNTKKPDSSINWYKSLLLKTTSEECEPEIIFKYNKIRIIIYILFSNELTVIIKKTKSIKHWKDNNYHRRFQYHFVINKKYCYIG
jgi:hypothetical protein